MIYGQDLTLEDLRHDKEHAIDVLQMGLREVAEESKELSTLLEILVKVDPSKLPMWAKRSIALGLNGFPKGMIQNDADIVASQVSMSIIQFLRNKTDFYDSLNIDKVEFSDRNCEMAFDLVIACIKSTLELNELYTENYEELLSRLNDVNLSKIDENSLLLLGSALSAIASRLKLKNNEFNLNFKDLSKFILDEIRDRVRSGVADAFDLSLLDLIPQMYELNYVQTANEDDLRRVCYSLYHQKEILALAAGLKSFDD